MALKLGIETYQILTNDDEVCIPSLSSIILAVCALKYKAYFKTAIRYYYLERVLLSLDVT